MKRIILAFLLTCMINVPGHAENSTCSTILLAQQVEDKCLKMSEDFSDGRLKGYGVATSFKEHVARAKALMQARAELASQLQSVVSSVQNMYFKLSEGNGQTIQTDVFEETIKTSVDIELGQSRIACSECRRLEDGTYRYSVCVALGKETRQFFKEIPQKVTETKKGKENWDKAVDAVLNDYISKINGK